jgi:putative transposase
MVVETCYPLGIPARRVEKLVEPLGITRLSKPQVSVMAGEIGAQVAGFRPPARCQPVYVVDSDVLVLTVRGKGPVVSMHALLATGVDGSG